MSQSRLKGLVALAAAAVEHGSAAIEKVQLDTAARTFGILERIPPLAAPTKLVRVVHDASVKTTHVSIRLVTAVVKGGVDVALDLATGAPPSGAAEARAAGTTADAPPTDVPPTQ